MCDGKAAVTHHHGKAGGEGARMLHHTVARLQHALHLPAVGALRQPLQGLTEVAKGSVLLTSLALVTLLHGGKNMSVHFSIIIFSLKLCRSTTN